MAGRDLGPLFGWSGEKSGKSGPSGPHAITTETTDDTVRDPGGPTGSGLNGPYISAPKRSISADSPAIPRSPDGPESPDFFSEIVNDSPRSRIDDFHSLREGTSPDFSKAPSAPSAALTLRSQRTGAGGLDRSPTLRPYQTAAIEAVERELADHLSTLLVLPTGCGKTVVFAELVRLWMAMKLRTLVLAHRTELLDQAAKKLLDVGVYAAIDQGDRKASLQADVVVGSVQTLQRKRLERYPVDWFDRIVIDEGHHAAAKSYRNVRERFPNARVLLVTATPDRADGKAMGKVAETVAFVLEMRKAIADGFLSPLRAKRILVENMDLSDVKTHHGDLDQAELSKLLNSDENLLGVVKPLLEQAGDRKTLVFGVDVAHARALAEVINAHRPGKAIALDGTSKPEERAAVLALFRKGVFQYLCNCALFTEGFDEPDIACVALARPTQSRALYTQMLGRGTRLAPGKADCLVLDFVGNSGKHRLVGPADALAGRELTDDERKIAEKKLDGQLELESVLADAEREAKEQKAARRREVNSAALVLYRSREIDLFLGDHMAAFDVDSAAAKRPATPEQLAELDHLKFGKPPIGISEAEASAMLKAVKDRRKLGLCTIPQARLVERWGVDAKKLTFTRAAELITMVASRNAWNRVGSVLSGQPEYQPNRRKS